MKFGLMTQLQIPRPWEPQAELTAYRNTIEQAVAGDAAGFHYFWLTEMHFFKQIGHSPCPDLHPCGDQPAHRRASGSASRCCC